MTFPKKGTFLARGIPSTVPTFLMGPQAGVQPGANLVRYYRLFDEGTISAIRLSVVNSIGNIEVAVYRSNGQTGIANAPASRIATSGTVAAPALGVQDIALPGLTVVEPGDWFALVASNAAFACIFDKVDSASLGLEGLRGYEIAASCPATPGVITYQDIGIIHLEGV